MRFGARDYDPLVGRWTAKDPILWEGGQGNLYVYVGADPINRIDPSGRIFFEVTGAALSALGLYVALGMSNPVGWGLLAAGAAMELYALYDEHNSGYDNLSKAQRKQDIVDDRNRRVKDALDELDRIDNGKPPRDSTGADGTQNTDNQGGCGDSN